MEIFDRQRVLQKKSSDIMFANFELLKPNWKFETVPEYLAAQRELQMLGQETKEMEYETIVASRNADYKKIELQRDELTKALETLSKDVAELEKKGE
jgi:hypothetical protein